MILTIDWVSSKYQAYRKKDVNGTIQEYVNTEYGATTCVSIAGMDTSWLTVPGEKDYATLMPIVSIKEIIPGKIDITDSSSGSGDGEESTSTPKISVDIPHVPVLYRNHHGQWGGTTKEVTKNLENIPDDIPSLPPITTPGIYFLVKHYAGTFEWILSDKPMKVRCPTVRGLYYARKGLNSVSAQLYRLIEFFNDAQVPPVQNDTILDPAFYRCRPMLRQLPRVVNLAILDAINDLELNKVDCNDQLQSLFDAVDFLTQKGPLNKKSKDHKIKGHEKRTKRSVFDLLGPSYDYTPIYETLHDLRDNLVYNHMEIGHHAARMKSLETIAKTEQEHLRMIATLHNLDVFSRDVDRASLDNLENLRYVNNIMNDAVKNLQSEAVLLANAVHFDASCFAHHHRAISCAKDIPRVNFTAEGKLTIEYYTEQIKLENRQYFTCLPTKFGLSYKHHHYSVQTSGATILLNNGRLIMNETGKDSFYEDYSHHIASIEACYFNARHSSEIPHIYLNCETSTDIQYRSNRGRMEVITVKPYQNLRINFDQFPITVRTQTLELKDILDKQTTVLFDDMYARVAREAWYSALHLPRALIEYKTKTTQHEYWSDMSKLAIKYPKVRYYFTVSLAVMSLTALGIIAGCLIRYRVNVHNCFVFLYTCCRPKDASELRTSPILRRSRSRRQSDASQDSGNEGKVKARVKDLEMARVPRQEKERRRTRSRSRSRRSRSRSRSLELPSYREVSTALLQDNSTQVRDKYATRPRRN